MWQITLYYEEEKDIITWEEFVIIFYHQYIPESMRQMKELEFINFQ